MTARIPETPPLKVSLACTLRGICLVCAILLTPCVEAQTATGAEATPERAIDRAELLNNLDDVRRQYPALYDRLRRGKREATTETAVSGTESSGAMTESTATTTEGTTAATTRTIDGLLKQEVKRGSTATSAASAKVAP